MIVRYDLSHLCQRSRQDVVRKAGETCCWDSLGVSEERRTSLGKARLKVLNFYV